MGGAPAMRESHKTGHEAAKLEIALVAFLAHRIGMLIPALVSALFALVQCVKYADGAQ